MQDENLTKVEFVLKSESLRTIEQAKIKFKLNKENVEYKNVKEVNFLINGQEVKRNHRILSVFYPDRFMKGWIILEIPKLEPMSKIEIKLSIETKEYLEEKNLVYEVLSYNTLLFTNIAHEKKSVFTFIIVALFIISVLFGIMFLKMYQK